MKTFNGRKMSHGVKRGKQRACAICGTTLIRLRGVLRCTELRRGGGEGKSNTYRMVKHGSERTIAKRQRRAA